MRTTLSLFLFTIIVAFTSCQKEISFQNGSGNNNGATGGTGGTNSTSNIVGDYDFVGESAQTQSTVVVSAGGQEFKSITTSDYATKNNQGTCKITSGEFIFNALAYSVDTVMNAKTFVDDVLFNDLDLPLVITLPPTNSTSPYTRISSDSISITGAAGVATDPSGAVPTGPVGVKLAWSGDTLLLKINYSFSQSITQNGQTGLLNGKITGVTKLKKH